MLDVGRLSKPVSSLMACPPFVECVLLQMYSKQLGQPINVDSSPPLFPSLDSFLAGVALCAPRN